MVFSMNHSKPIKARPKLYCLHYNQCDPKKCTALKLKKFHLIEIIHKIKGPLNNSIVLNPFSQKELVLKDREVVSKYGLIVIDCSWKKFLEIKNIKSDNYRKLSPLIAVNPVNYGKWEKLSSVEALAAALFQLKYEDYAKLLLSKFPWGQEFFKINYEINRK